MTKELDPVAEAAFKQRMMEHAADEMLNLQMIMGMNPKQLADGGYGATTEEAVMTALRIAIRQRNLMSAAHLKSQK